MTPTLTPQQEVAAIRLPKPNSGNSSKWVRKMLTGRRGFLLLVTTLLVAAGVIPLACRVSASSLCRQRCLDFFNNQFAYSCRVDGVLSALPRLTDYFTDVLADMGPFYAEEPGTACCRFGRGCPTQVNVSLSCRYDNDTAIRLSLANPNEYYKCPRPCRQQYCGYAGVAEGRAPLLPFRFCNASTHYECEWVLDVTDICNARCSSGAPNYECLPCRNCSDVCPPPSNETTTTPAPTTTTTTTTTTPAPTHPPYNYTCDAEHNASFTQCLEADVLTACATDTVPSEECWQLGNDLAWYSSTYYGVDAEVATAEPEKWPSCAADGAGTTCVINMVSDTPMNATVFCLGVLPDYWYDYGFLSSPVCTRSGVNITLTTYSAWSSVKEYNPALCERVRCTPLPVTTTPALTSTSTSTSTTTTTTAPTTTAETTTTGPTTTTTTGPSTATVTTTTGTTTTEPTTTTGETTTTTVTTTTPAPTTTTAPPLNVTCPADMVVYEAACVSHPIGDCLTVSALPEVQSGYCMNLLQYMLNWLNANGYFVGIPSLQQHSCTDFYSMSGSCYFQVTWSTEAPAIIFGGTGCTAFMAAHNLSGSGCLGQSGGEAHVNAQSSLVISSGPTMCGDVFCDDVPQLAGECPTMYWPFFRECSVTRSCNGLFFAGTYDGYYSDQYLLLQADYIARYLYEHGLVATRVYAGVVLGTSGACDEATATYRGFNDSASGAVIKTAFVNFVTQLGCPTTATGPFYSVSTGWYFNLALDCLQTNITNTLCYGAFCDYPERSCPSAYLSSFLQCLTKDVTYGCDPDSGYDFDSVPCLQLMEDINNFTLANYGFALTNQMNPQCVGTSGQSYCSFALTAPSSGEATTFVDTVIGAYKANYSLTATFVAEAMGTDVVFQVASYTGTVKYTNEALCYQVRCRPVVLMTTTTSTTSTTTPTTTTTTTTTTSTTTVTTTTTTTPVPTTTTPPPLNTTCPADRVPYEASCDSHLLTQCLYASSEVALQTDYCNTLFNYSFAWANANGYYLNISATTPDYTYCHPGVTGGQCSWGFSFATSALATYFCNTVFPAFATAYTLQGGAGYCGPSGAYVGLVYKSNAAGSSGAAVCNATFCQATQLDTTCPPAFWPFYRECEYYADQAWDAMTNYYGTGYNPTQYCTLLGEYAARWVYEHGLWDVREHPVSGLTQTGTGTPNYCRVYYGPYNTTQTAAWHVFSYASLLSDSGFTVGDAYYGVYNHTSGYYLRLDFVHPTQAGNLTVCQGAYCGYSNRSCSGVLFGSSMYMSCLSRSVLTCGNDGGDTLGSAWVSHLALDIATFARSYLSGAITYNATGVRCSGTTPSMLSEMTFSLASDADATTFCNTTLGAYRTASDLGGTSTCSALTSPPRAYVRMTDAIPSYVNEETCWRVFCTQDII